MGTTLSNESEAVTFQQALDVPWLQNRDGAHDLRDLDRVGADELCLEPWFPILQQERHNLAEIVQQLVNARALGMSARPAWDVADEQPGVGITFDDGSECAHSGRGPSGDP